MYCNFFFFNLHYGIINVVFYFYYFFMKNEFIMKFIIDLILFYRFKIILNIY